MPLAWGHYSAWLELHIEQGPLLERDGIDCGVVTGIAGPASYRFTVEGLGGHAGALLMPDRRDALCAAAEVVLAIERAALKANAQSGAADTVATVGMLTVYPGAVNSVPSRVVFSLDLRDTEAARRERTTEAIRAAVRVVEARRDVKISEEMVNADAPVVSDPRLVRVLGEACAAEGVQLSPHGLAGVPRHQLHGADCTGCHAVYPLPRRSVAPAGRVCEPRVDSAGNGCTSEDAGATRRGVDSV